VNCVTSKDAMAVIQSGMSVFVHGGAATPQVLLTALMKEADHLRDVELIHLHTEGIASYADSKYHKSFKVSNLFVGPNMRPYLDYQHVDYLPCFLSEIPQLFRSRRKPLDAALIHVSPPDAHGYCTLGVSVDVALSAVESSRVIIAQINPQMPRVHGDGFIHVSKITHCIEVDEPLPVILTYPMTEIERRVGSHVSGLVEDGATLQIGIGSLPEAILYSLDNHKHLGIHSEMWSDGVLRLIQIGVVDNSKKKVHPGKTVAGFSIGSKKFYEFIHDNPSVVHLGIDYVNSPQIISRNPKVSAINSAIQIDLTGQVCADSIGSSIISGVGGQMDFMRGASLSEGGKPIIAITSRSKKGHARIVSKLHPGAGVVTTRAHVHFVVTEYGIADLFGKTLCERAKAMIQIAHPGDREGLEREWHSLYRE
jgi:4-hydroxybutyrate CoA-transferase